MGPIQRDGCIAQARYNLLYGIDYGLSSFSFPICDTSFCGVVFVLMIEDGNISTYD